MKFTKTEPVRIFSPGNDISLSDCGSLNLSVDEQITIVDDNGFKSDLTCKEWGYYLANSINHRILEQGFKTALFSSKLQSPPSLYVCLVKESKIDQFMIYLDKVEARLIMWLDEFNDDNF
ncbi:hypothetical protein [Maridesulfovibrio frigidus]|uniref:hypothetical protein n=1 Tax=Maridesulfovibrio frigidus TaxID=340956 RepID=UPI00054ED5E9|nr:hypothetical protein [Maridesulfovibrio frigidus]